MRSSHYERLENVLPEPGRVLRAAEQTECFRSRPAAIDMPEPEDLPARHRSLLGAHGASFCSSEVHTGLEPLLAHEEFIEASRRLYGRPIVRPFDLHVGLLTPGQRMQIHTNIPEFRGLGRETDPDWLLVAMHHSGLFDDWRIAVVTAVAWFGTAPEGGEFVFYPDGPFGRSVAVRALDNTAIVFDASTLYHGVDHVAGAPAAANGTELRFVGDSTWVLSDGLDAITRFKSSDLRLSAVWSARCFYDEAEERKVHDHSRDLTRARVLETLGDGLRRRGILRGDTTDETAIARAIADEYIKIPPGAPAT